MNRYDEIHNSIIAKTAKVTIIGLGYVGLPTALFYAMHGIAVRGIDTNESLINDLKNGQIPLNEEGLNEIAREHLHKVDLQSTYDCIDDSDIFVLCLPSPIDGEGKPIITFLESAVDDIARRIRTGCLILNESTVPVGTTQKLSSLFSQKSGLTKDEFWFAHCPERVLPGKIIGEMETNHRLAGGTTMPSSDLAAAFLQSIFKPELIHKTTSRISETAKLAENAFRDVNIGYANELAKMCESLSIDVFEVIRLANLHPRVSILNPGPGVGGYCLPKDGWILVESAREHEYESRIIPAARSVNDGMPAFVANRIASEVSRLGQNAVVGILGLAFKENVSDTRNSPSIELLNELVALGIDVIVYDPLVHDSFGHTKASSVKHLLELSTIIVLAVGHRNILNELDSEDLSNKTLIDPKNIKPNLRSKVRKYVSLSV